MIPRNKHQRLGTNNFGTAGVYRASLFQEIQDNSTVVEYYVLLLEDSEVYDGPWRSRALSTHSEGGFKLALTIQFLPFVEVLFEIFSRHLEEIAHNRKRRRTLLICKPDV